MICGRLSAGLREHEAGRSTHGDGDATCGNDEVRIDQERFRQLDRERLYPAQLPPSGLVRGCRAGRSRIRPALRAAADAALGPQPPLACRYRFRL